MEVQTNTHHLANLSKWSSPVAVTSSTGVAPVSIQEFLNIFTLNAHVTRQKHTEKVEHCLISTVTRLAKKVKLQKLILLNIIEFVGHKNY